MNIEVMIVTKIFNGYYVIVYSIGFSLRKANVDPITSKKIFMINVLLKTAKSPLWFCCLRIYELMCETLGKKRVVEIK